MRSFALALLVCCASASVHAQHTAPASASAPESKEPFVKSTAEEAVHELAAKLEDNFVFPDKGKAYAAMLRANLAAGKYSTFADAEAFADAVTADLQAVHKDGHLRVHVVPPHARGGPDAERAQGAQGGSGMPDIDAIPKSGWIADGIAYIRFDLFPGDKQTLTELREFIETHKDARTLIIDARAHRGGGLAEMDLLFPYLFAEPTILVDMDTRAAVDERGGDPIEQEASVRKVAAPEGVVRREHFVKPAAQRTGLATAQVYLLTSKKTASAAEHLSLSLKRTKRATLIGETTRGAGHYGSMEPLDKGFTYAAFIPVGRTFDPDTGEGWEGVGVKPDVAVPADKALDEALKLSGVDKPAQVALAELK